MKAIYSYLFAFLLNLTFINSWAVAAESQPVMDKHAGFSALPDQTQGRILVSAYLIPKSQGAAFGFYLLGALAGAPQAGGHPFNVTLYDVTDEDPKLIGMMSAQHGMSGGNPANMDYRYGWIEYNAPVGKRIVMLTTKGLSKGSSLHTDFIEVNVEPGKVTHVTLSQYGIMRFAYFGEIDLSASNYQFCSGLAGSDKQKVKDTISQFMSEHDMPSNTRDFANYCRALAEQDSVLQPADTLVQKFEDEKSSVVAIKNDQYVNWTRQAEKPEHYDLMKAYEDKKLARDNALGAN